MSAARDEVTGVDQHAVVGEAARSRQRRDLHRAQRVGRTVGGVAEAEVGRCRRYTRVSSSVLTVLSVPAGASFTAVTSMLIVLADWIQIHPAVGDAAVVLHLEGEARVARARWRWPPG
mgnify:CR=1 FL=1